MTFPMTCIICPMGCTMEVTAEETENGKQITKITDNGCNRGPEYVKKELLNPTRTLTTTMKVLGGSIAVVPVKTAGEIPKNMQLLCMEVIRRQTCKAPVKRGQILYRDILGTGINIIACANVDAVLK